MKRFVIAMIVSMLLLVSAVAEAQTTVGVGGGVLVPVGGNATGAVSVGADILGVKTDMQLGAMNLRLWLSRTPFGTSESGATVDPSLKMNFWQPRCLDVGYQYLVGSIDISGVDARRLKDAKVWLKSDCNGCTLVPIKECGCERKFSINLNDLPNGVYALDIASYNNAKKNSLTGPFGLGSIGISRNTQRVNGYYQFTIFDPSTILSDFFTGIPEIANCDRSLRSRIEEAYLLQRFSYSISPSRPDLDLVTLQGRLNQLLNRQTMMNGDGQPLAVGTITYFIKFTYPDGTDYCGPVMVYTDDEDGTYPAFQVTAPLVRMGNGATAGTKGFAFELLSTATPIPRKTYCVENGTVVPITVPCMPRR